MHNGRCDRQKRRTARRKARQQVAIARYRSVWGENARKGDWSDWDERLRQQIMEVFGA